MHEFLMWTLRSKFIMPEVHKYKQFTPGLWANEFLSFHMPAIFWSLIIEIISNCRNFLHVFVFIHYYVKIRASIDESQARIDTKISSCTDTAKLWWWNFLNAYGERARLAFKKLFETYFQQKNKVSSYTTL